MTKKQREDLARRQARLAQMGIQIGANDKNGKQKKKRVVYGFRKNRNRMKEEEQKKRKEEELRKKKEEEERLEKERKEAEEKKRLEAEQKSKDNESESSSSDDDADGWAANLNSDSDDDNSDDDDNEDWDENELNLDLNLDDKDEALEEKKREEEEMRKKEAERQAKAKMKQQESPKENKKSSNTKKKKKKKNNKKSKNTAPVTSSNKKKKDDHATLMRNSKERRRRLRLEAKENALSVSKRFRSPIVCVMGHVDTGKTKILDKMRRSNIQDGEAGGITQHIGATQFPADALRRLTSSLLDQFNLECKIPGLLTIDTPGHESFSNLRGRGSSICDIAILVVDIMHGIEPQTAESLRMLRKGKTPFVVALNKVDRCYGWKTQPNSPIRKAMAKQEKYTIDEFRDRAKQAILQFNEKGLNAALYWENKSMKDTISLVPTSAITGEGIPDLLTLLIQMSQQFIPKRLTFVPYLSCTVLEVKCIEGLGT